VSRVWSQPLRTVHPAGRVPQRQVSAHPGYRSSWPGGTGTRQQIRKGRRGGNGHGRNGAPVRWQLRRIYLRPGDAGPDGKSRTALGYSGSDPRNVTDGVGIFVQVAPPGKGRAAANSRRHDIRWPGGRGDHQNHRAIVAATTRRPDREKLLRANGVDQVFIDTGSIAEQVREVFPSGVGKVLELVGTTTLLDSLRSGERCA
jgi:hypothetical protein